MEDNGRRNPADEDAPRPGAPGRDEQPRSRDIDTRPAGDWKPQDSSGATLEDDLEAKENELIRMTQGREGVPPDPDGDPKGIEDAEGLLSQSIDPEAQES